MAEPAQTGSFDSWRVLLANSLSSGPASPGLGALTFPPHPGYALLGCLSLQSLRNVAPRRFLLPAELPRGMGNPGTLGWHAPQAGVGVSQHTGNYGAGGSLTLAC